MTVTPSSLTATPFQTLKTHLSNVSAFQTWVSAANAAAALSSIYLITAGGSASLPFALIEDPDEGSRWRVTRPAYMHFRTSGQLMLTFWWGVTAGLDEADAYFTFANSVGGIVQGILELPVASAPLWITGMSCLDGPLRTKEAKTSDRYWQRFLVNYGRD